MAMLPLSFSYCVPIWLRYDVFAATAHTGTLYLGLSQWEKNIETRAKHSTINEQP
jgi:hypothetical protein